MDALAELRGVEVATTLERDAKSLEQARRDRLVPDHRRQPAGLDRTTGELEGGAGGLAAERHRRCGARRLDCRDLSKAIDELLAEPCERRGLGVGRRGERDAERQHVARFEAQLRARQTGEAAPK
jgi:hypothetical protein